MPITIKKPTRKSEIRRYMNYAKKDLAILLYDTQYALNIISRRVGAKITQSPSVKERVNKKQ